ncbi:MAG: N-acetylmuramoyl-L-alanine amidase [Caldilineaceae bacterium]
MRHDTVERTQRIFVWLFFLAVVGIGAIAARTAGIYPTDAQGLARQGLVPSAWNKQVAIISGHAGNDSGAICEDANGQPTIQEADVNAGVARLVAERVRQAGADVEILEEYDPRLKDLSADVFLSIHSDSCIDASGYKSSRYVYSTIPDTADRLVACINLNYEAATGLTENVDTITENMTEYHAFHQIDANTPAAIIELGFLGGDNDLLANHQDTLAKGVADGLLCFLNGGPQPTPVPAPTLGVTSTAEPTE